MKFGIDRLLEEPALRKSLQGKRVALLAHPASVTRELAHSMDALAALDDIDLAAAFRLLTPMLRDLSVVFEYPVEKMTPEIRAGYDWASELLERASEASQETLHHTALHCSKETP